jgi:hypothetical protein
MTVLMKGIYLRRMMLYTSEINVRKDILCLDLTSHQLSYILLPFQFKIDMVVGFVISVSKVKRV